MDQKMKIIFILVSALLVLVPAARADVGLRLGSYTDANKLFIGGEYNTAVARQTFFNPNLEYIFVDNGTFLTVNFDLHYDFVETSKTFLWAGGGLAVLHTNYEGENNSSTKAGLNVLFGLGLKTRGHAIPYVQGKFILGDYDDFVVGLGIRF